MKLFVLNQHTAAYSRSKAAELQLLFDSKNILTSSIYSAMSNLFSNNKLKPAAKSNYSLNWAATVF